MTIIDICQEGLCMEVAVARVTVSTDSEKVKAKVCADHLSELRDKVAAANEEPGAQLTLTVVPIAARVA